MLYKSIQQACGSNIIFQMNKPASLKSLKGQMGFLRATFDQSPKHQHLVSFQQIMVGRIERQIRIVTNLFRYRDSMQFNEENFTSLYE